jgi:hypothetical protein
VNKLVAFLGHDDAVKVTPDDVIRFKDHRLSEVSPKTVNDGDLAALKTILGWGRTNRRLTINAAEGITIKLRKKPKRVRPNWVTDDEAVAAHCRRRLPAEAEGANEALPEQALVAVAVLLYRRTRW